MKKMSAGTHTEAQFNHITLLVLIVWTHQEFCKQNMHALPQG